MGTGRGRGQGSQSWPHCLADGPTGHGPAPALSGRAPPASCDNFIQLLSSWGHKYSGNKLPRGKTAALFWRAPGLLSPPELPSLPGGTGLAPWPLQLWPCPLICSRAGEQSHAQLHSLAMGTQPGDGAAGMLSLLLLMAKPGQQPHCTAAPVAILQPAARAGSSAPAPA